jgi:hypothetical protein
VRREEGLREEGDGVRVRAGCCVIYQGNTLRTIGSTIDGCKSLGYLGRHGLLCLLFFLFLFSFLLHHCEVILKNNYVICTNIFFIYNNMNTSFHLGVSRFFEWICYFLSFK